MSLVEKKGAENLVKMLFEIELPEMAHTISQKLATPVNAGQRYLNICRCPAPSSRARF